jgi:hypothetical protein
MDQRVSNSVFDLYVAHGSTAVLKKRGISQPMLHSGKNIYAL